MKNLPAEVIYILLFVAIVLFNYMMKRLAGRNQQGPAGDQPPGQGEPVEQEEPFEVIFGRSRTAPEGATQPETRPAPDAARHARPVAAERMRRRPNVRSLLRGERNLRNAIVVMTVLGPCRAQEPTGERSGRGPA